MRIALVHSREPERAARVDDPLAAALADRGAEVARPVWDDDAVAWPDHDLVVVRTTWDYVDRRDEFLAWAEATARSVPVHNTPDVLRWNTHKSYLLELEERGAPVVPTAWLGRGDQVAVGDVLAARGWRRAVVKPAVGVGGRDQVVVEAEAAGEAQRVVDELLAAGDVLVQPYLARVEEEGELSVVVAGGEVTHAVRKRPAPGEYRVQQERGARYELAEADADTAALARWVVESTGQELLLARVDLLADELGALQLVELEATEPDLYLGLAPEATERIADLLIGRASSA